MSPLTSIAELLSDLRVNRVLRGHEANKVRLVIDERSKVR
jgi:hypothetical protein